MFFCKKKKKEAVKKLTNVADEKVKPAVNQLSETAKDQVSPLIAEAVDKADQIAADVKEIADEQVQQLSRQIKTKPIMMVVIFMVIGYFLGRITR